MSKSYQDTLLELAEADERIVVMTAENRAAIRQLPAKLGARFIDVGIAEQTMIGAAAGLALRGRIPVVHALSTFLTLRAFEFIRTDLGIAGLKALLVGGVPGFLSDGNGPTHQAIEDIALMRGIPGFHVFCPADGAELVAALPALVESRQPCYIRYFDGPATVAHAPFEIGRAETLSEGDDVAILTIGFLLREALAAKELLEQRGRSVRLVNVRMVAPLDRAMLREAAKARLLVTIEDHFRIGGLYSAVLEELARARLLPHLCPIALEQRWFKPGRLDGVLKAEGFTGPQLAERINRALEELS
jgi:transketolase